MYVLYLDASGTPELQDSSQHYVLIGLCMHEGSWFALDKRLQDLKRRYCLEGTDPDQLEIHVKEFAGTIKEQDEISDFEQMARVDRRARVLDIQKTQILAETSEAGRERRRTRYKRSSPYIHLSRRERSQLLEDAIDVIAGYDSLRLFGEAIHKSHPAVVSGTADLRVQAFTQVVARFDRFLQKKAAWRQQKSTRPRVDNGLLMHDHDQSTQPVVEQLFKQFRQRGHTFGQIRHVIDVPFFGSSNKVGGLQLADVAAYVVRRYLDQGAIAGSHEERHFMKIFQKFDRDTLGKLHGLRHYVPSASCQCLICRERGHSAN